MEKSVSNLWTTQLLEDALRLFGATSTAYRLISDLENFVYECRRGDEPFILRVTHSSHRNHSALMAELDWVAYSRSQTHSICSGKTCGNDRS